MDVLLTVLLTLWVMQMVKNVKVVSRAIQEKKVEKYNLQILYVSSILKELYPDLYKTYGERMSGDYFVYQLGKTFFGKNYKDDFKHLNLLYLKFSNLSKSEKERLKLCILKILQQ